MFHFGGRVSFGVDVTDFLQPPLRNLSETERRSP
jgi:hypothetical protein